MRIISLTLFVLFVVLFVNSVYAQDSLRTYYTGEIVVTSENEAIIKTTSTVDIDKSEIDTKDNFSVDASLSQISGMYMANNQRNESIFKLRGYDQRQTAVFFDGVPLYISYDGAYDFSQINSASIGKITISKSMSSVLYGANTMGGSVNILSDEPLSTTDINAKVMYGNTYGALVKSSGIYKSFYWLVSSNYNKSDGFNLPSVFTAAKNENGGKRDNSSFEQKGGMFKAGYRMNTSTDFMLEFNKTLNSKDVPTQIYTNFPRYWKYTDWNNSLVNFISNIKIGDALKIRTNAYTVNSYNVLNAYDNSTYTTQTKNSSFTSTYDDYSTGISLIPELNVTKLISAKFALLYKRDTHYDQANYNKPNKKFTAETYTGGIEKNFKVSDFDLITALNYNYLNVVYANDSITRPGIPVLNGHIGIGKSITDNIYLYTHISNNSRFPTLKELFSEQLGKSIPNPNLDVEKNWNTELGIKYKNPKSGNINLSLYYSKVRNMITAVPVSNTQSQFQNIGSVTFYGFELNYQHMFQYFNLETNYTYLSSKNNSDTTTDKLEYRPEHSFNIILSDSYTMGFSWNLESSFISQRYGINSDTRLWVTLPDYTIFNLRIAQKFLKKYSAFIRVNNIADKYFESEYGFPQAGRNFVIGIDANF